jgi:hypothetical protein
MISMNPSKPATKCGIKAGGVEVTDILVSSYSNHNQAAKGLRVKSSVKAGLSLNFAKVEYSSNHNQTAKCLRVKSGVKAGAKPNPGSTDPKE